MPKSRRKAASPTQPAPQPVPSDREAPTGPAYGVSFGRVWRAALDVVRETERWRLVNSDPVRGEIAAEIRPLLRGAPRAARIVVALDDLGLTRVAASLPEERRVEGAAPPRQIAGFYRRLERILARGG